MGITLQVIHKTYCCVEHKDKNIFNEDLCDDSDTEDNDDKEKLIVEQINSFHTEPDKTIN